MFSRFEGLLVFTRAEEGVTAIEYALIAALIALAIVASVTTLGQTIRDLFNSIAASMP